MLQYGLIGYPLKNSFSENYFNSKFRKLGIDAQYANYPLASIDLFPKLLQNHPKLKGLNVTIPYKEKIIPYLNEVEDTAKEIGAVNTIKILENKLIGYNTDIFGFEKSILPLLKPWHQQALVLGSGGAAKAIMFVLKKFGINYTIVSRNKQYGILYEQIDKATIRTHQLIINCTPVGMYPNSNNYPDIPYQFITPLHLALDLIYLPEQTIFLQKCKQQEAVIQNGIIMLEQQAEKSWEIWNL
ncbi:MAG: shikimate dehydrogenase [Bacteroidia bacterium]|nr:shikimate dehydrogenase [Bacteroidia bacterium]